ncbi:right-handed parallel beta-helix repeat-containing protein [Micromonospora sp. NPDC049559]|uniref:right-handed parallel beta-helix repeat-containing protein n=1 Tax=Micromonospora sp. NPDC049559 TaxID=3155923 RepID=UPI0034127D7F
MPARTLSCLATAITLAATLVVAAGPAHAAPPVACGDTVTADVVLTADLTCPGDGLSIGADGVTVDLNGHTISGSATGTGIQAVEVDDLRVRDGVIRGFTIGVLLENVGDAELHGLRLLDNGGGTGGARARAGVFADRVTRLLIQGGRIVAHPGTPTAPAFAIRTEVANDLVIRGVDLTGRSTLAINTEAPRVIGNTVRDGGLSLSESNGAVVRGNIFLRAGIWVSECAGVRILQNVLTGGRGIDIGIASDTVVRGNLVRNAQYGVITDVVTSGLRVEENTFTGNGYGVRADVGSLSELDGLLVRGNRMVGNEQAGMFLEAEASTGAPARILISGNQFVRNGHASTGTDSAGRRIDDGLHTNVPASPDVVVARNLTLHNADFGIEALPVGSVRDGGGNVSTGDPSGCAGVACR